MSWKTDTLDEMEETSMGEYDYTCSKKIFDKWLEVICNDPGEGFTYKFGNKIINRNEADLLMKDWERYNALLLLNWG